MAFLSQFMAAADVAKLSDKQVEILSAHAHATMLKATLNNQQVKGQVSNEITTLLPVVQASHPN